MGRWGNISFVSTDAEVLWGHVHQGSGLPTESNPSTRPRSISCSALRPERAHRSGHSGAWRCLARSRQAPPPRRPTNPRRRMPRGRQSGRRSASAKARRAGTRRSRSRAHLAARDQAEDHRGDAEEGADLVRCEVEAERDNQGENGPDEGEGRRPLAAQSVPRRVSVSPPVTSRGRHRPCSRLRTCPGRLPG